MKKLQIDETNRKWLKQNFMFHGKTIYKWSRNEQEEEFLNDVWRLVQDCMKFAYAKGYRTGHLKGFARGLSWEEKK
ncbi:hypothetical protein KY320_01495 [Candidatus Woesearchaeota archaeon]|nr:hypothetical protein [Candidatus Woesearchaeota archaeon]